MYILQIMIGNQYLRYTKNLVIEDVSLNMQAVIIIVYKIIMIIIFNSYNHLFLLWTQSVQYYKIY